MHGTFKGRKMQVEKCASNNQKKEWSQGSRRATLQGPKDPDIRMVAATYSSTLWRLACAKALADGKRVHGHIIEREHQRNGYLDNLLLQMYGKCGALDDAHALFATMHQRDVFSWTALIGAYAQDGQGKRAFQLFQQMHLEGVMPNRFTFLSILPACANQRTLCGGKQIHALIAMSELEGDVVVGTSLVNMYGKFAELEHAQDMFNNIHERNLVSWTAIIAAYAQQHRGKQAFQLFQQMLLEGLIPDKVTFISILDGCGSLAEVVRVHVCTVAIGYESDVVVGNVLVSTYAKCGHFLDARKIFHQMCERNVVSWTSMISAYTQHGLAKEAVQLYRRMHLEGVMPNTVTSVTVLSACANLDALAEGKRMHIHTVGSEVEPDVVVGNAILNVYGKCGSLNYVQIMFDKMPERDIISWNVMIAAYAKYGQGKEALQVFQKMQQEGLIPDRATLINILEVYTSQAALAEGQQMHCQMLDKGFYLDVELGTVLINMYGKCGSLEAAWRVFDNMQEKDLILWTAMIAAYAQNGQNKQAVCLFYQMQVENLIPNKVTLVSLLLACCNQADLTEGKRIHARIIVCDLQLDVTLGTALVSMYSKCGNLDDAKKIFDRLCMQNVISWNAMITAYAQNGHGKEALRLFQHMQRQDMMPDEITFSSILSACAHAGLVEEGCQCFVSMIQLYHMKPNANHYICMVDLFGRAGQLDKGENLINNIPYQPTNTFWTTLLGGCKMHFDVERGEQTAKHVLELSQEDEMPYVSLSNIYVI